MQSESTGRITLVNADACTLSMDIILQIMLITVCCSQPQYWNRQSRTISKVMNK